MAMVKDPVAVRYAESLFELGKAEGTLDRLAEQLDTLAALISEHDALRQLLLNPDVDIPDKLRVLERLLGELWTPDLRAFIHLVLTMERPMFLVQMAGSLREMVDTERRIRRVTVRTARPLASTLRERLTQWLAKHEQCQIQLIEEVDPALLGGIQVAIKHRTFDGSVRTQLDRLRQRLHSVRVH